MTLMLVASLESFMVILVDCAGIAMSLSYGPAFLLMGKYFHKHLTLATAISNTGTGVGAFIMPFIIRAVLDEFSFPAGLLVVGGLAAHLYVVAAFYRPVSQEEFEEAKAEAERREAIEKEENEIDSDHDEASENDFEKAFDTSGDAAKIQESGYAITDEDKHVELCPRELASSNAETLPAGSNALKQRVPIRASLAISPIFTDKITSDRRVSGEDSHENEQSSKEAHVPKKIKSLEQNDAEFILPQKAGRLEQVRKGSSRSRTYSESAKDGHRIERDTRVSSDHDKLHSSLQHFPANGSSTELEIVSVTPLRNRRSTLLDKLSRSSLATLTMPPESLYASSLSKINLFSGNHHDSRLKIEISRNPSIVNVEQNKTLQQVSQCSRHADNKSKNSSQKNRNRNTNLRNSGQIVDKVDSLHESKSESRNKKRKCCGKADISVTCCTCDTTACKNWVMWAVVVYQTFGVVTGVAGNAFVPPLAREKGLNSKEATFLLTLLGGLDIASRLLPGLVVHYKLMRPDRLCILTLTMQGILCQVREKFCC
jgi:hypothetical protein